MAGSYFLKRLYKEKKKMYHLLGSYGYYTYFKEELTNGEKYCAADNARFA